MTPIMGEPNVKRYYWTLKISCPNQVQFYLFINSSGLMKIGNSKKHISQ